PWGVTPPSVMRHGIGPQPGGAGTIAALVQPPTASHVSAVHGSWSSQTIGSWCMPVVGSQESAVQAFWSSVLIWRLLQPVDGSLLSSVPALWSSQSIGSWWTPCGSQECVVQALPSSVAVG